MKMKESQWRKSISMVNNLAVKMVIGETWQTWHIKRHQLRVVAWHRAVCGSCGKRQHGAARIAASKSASSWRGSPVTAHAALLIGVRACAQTGVSNGRAASHHASLVAESAQQRNQSRWRNGEIRQSGNVYLAWPGWPGCGQRGEMKYGK
jgi:hypothetical protein